MYVAFESEQTEVLSTYISLGSNGSEKIRRCTNVLFKAIQLGKPKMIESAPSHQADLEATNDQGKTALMVAVEGRCKGADTNARCGSGLNRSLLQGAIQSQQAYENCLTFVCGAST